LKAIFIQFIKFFGLSGLGWCIDFSLYLILTLICGLPVFYANCISSIPAVTLVFFVSTRKIFEKNNSKIPLFIKYLIYVLYQFVLLTGVSALGQYIAAWITAWAGNRMLIAKAGKIIAKLFITPITMVINFIVMKGMAEKF